MVSKIKIILPFGFLIVAIIIALSLTERDPAVKECRLLSKTTLQETCLAELGILRGDINICDKSGQSRFYCYTKLAELKKAYSICPLIEDEYWQSICYNDAGITLNELSLCHKANLTRLKDDCLYEVSLNTTDYKGCSGVSDNIMRVRCHNLLAKKLLDPEVCFSLNGLDRDRCIYGVAKIAVNSSACNLIKAGELKKLCLENTTPTILPSEENILSA